jgi:hypothetical protein
VSLRLTFAIDFVEGVFGGLGPDERVLAVIPASDEGADLDHQVAGGGEAAAADGLASDDAEPDLDHPVAGCHKINTGTGEDGDQPL